ncbi:hypothetical protein NFHSH190041_08870 [Shewanella sp. NFH-SH190041]|nr:hypothetical protein NFHSH190041_08870 [Shewanella sp. NFH-SH190041]
MQCGYPEGEIASIFPLFSKAKAGYYYKNAFADLLGIKLIKYHGIDCLLLLKGYQFIIGGWLS